MKHDLTTGTWQDDTGCPISIILVSTSDDSHKDGIMMYPRLWFAPQKTTRRIPNVFTMRELWYCGKDSSTCTSTAHEDCNTPYMCLTLMWEPFWMGLKPQGRAKTQTVVCSSEDNQNSEFQMVLQWELWYCGKDLSIYTSTATEGCNTPYMYFILMFEPYWMGL